MSWETTKIYHGFQLLWQKEVKEINSNVLFFRHQKTAAELMFMQNDDTNKVFTIFFKTPPEDSTGCPHILEHSVLMGSKNFPIKDPFTELVKGSLNTFLNAFTSSDKTMYPVASMNHQDFLNLMTVYLDAVFYPNIYQYPEIFWQEGWHHEFTDSGDLIYKGVVYNEMKGAFSSPESVLYRMVQSIQNPDNAYSYESGGDPEVIPDLTYDKFINFHRNHYHPSNSRIVLYGDVELDSALQRINDNYLSHFEQQSFHFEIAKQKPFDKPLEVTASYPISQSEDTAEKAYLSLNFSFSDIADVETGLAFAVLEHLLMDTPAAPLKKAIIDAGIGKDTMAYYDDGILQPIFGVIVKNSEVDRKEKFREVVYSTLRDLVKNGIDKKLIEASINSREFQLREAEMWHFPKGLFYAYIASKTWLHGLDPLLNLEYEKILPKLKTALTEPYFENLIEKYILNNTHSSLLMLVPSKTMAEEREAKTKEKLDHYLKSLSLNQKTALKLENDRLIKRQKMVDSEEVLAMIPILELKDLNAEAEKLPLQAMQENGYTVLEHELFANGIAYFTAYFNAGVVPFEDYQYLKLLAYCMGKVDTRHYTYSDLSRDVNIHTGGIGVGAEHFNNPADNYETAYPYLTVSGKVLGGNVPHLMSLVSEILNYSKFDDKDRLLDILRELKSQVEMNLMRSGHLVAIQRVASYYNASGLVGETLNGVRTYHAICELENHFDERFEELKTKLEVLAGRIFRTGHLVFSLTGEARDIRSMHEGLATITGPMESGELPLLTVLFQEEHKNEALLGPSNVQYVAQAYNMRKLGYQYSGKMQVLKSVMAKDYLHNLIRARGGAYGAMCFLNRFGNVYFCSYRDPNLAETYEVYKTLKKYLQDFTCSERDIVKYIIGTIAEVDRPLTPSQRGAKAAGLYLAAVTDEQRQQERSEILSTTVEDIRGYADMIDQIIQQNCICTLGNENKIRQNAQLFGELVPIFSH